MHRYCSHVSSVHKSELFSPLLTLTRMLVYRYQKQLLCMPVVRTSIFTILGEVSNINNSVTNSHNCNYWCSKRNISNKANNVPEGKRLNSQQEVLEIPSAYALLRMCYRSIDIKVKSRHARNFLKQRLIEQWSSKCKETDPVKQRHYMELAGSFLQSLHTDRNPTPNMTFHYQLSRRVAYEEKMKEKTENTGKYTVRRRIPRPEPKEQQ